MRLTTLRFLSEHKDDSVIYLHVRPIGGGGMVAFVHIVGGPDFTMSSETGELRPGVMLLAFEGTVLAARDFIEVAWRTFVVQK